jgi:hypothetical protein
MLFRAHIGLGGVHPPLNSDVSQAAVDRVPYNLRLPISSTPRRALPVLS